MQISGSTAKFMIYKKSFCISIFRGAFLFCMEGGDTMLSKLNLSLLTSSTGGLGKEIYTHQNNNITTAGTKIIKLVGSIGGLAFTLAVMIIAIAIIFGSISPKNIGRWWTALFSCVGGAVLFFGAYLFSDVIANLF